MCLNIRLAMSFIERIKDRISQNRDHIYLIQTNQPDTNPYNIDTHKT